jgi:hypothetical protein
VDKALLSWLNSTIVWRKFLSQTGAGEPSYAQVSSFKAYIATSDRIVRSVEGEEVVSKTQLFVNGSDATQITLKDELTLPNGSKPPIIGIDLLYDEKGIVDYGIVYL